jgi:hypothetical protein
MPDGKKGKLQGTLRNLTDDPVLDPGSLASGQPSGYKSLSLGRRGA